ncbi:hypothetical protein BDZ45DRAFT_781836, partial [Acephala macrosclerotiorum]
MSTALMNQTHPIVYHACHCGWQDVWEWAAIEVTNHWQIEQNISDDFNYPGLRDGYYYDVLDMLDGGNNITKYLGPSHWNDYDILKPVPFRKRVLIKLFCDPSRTCFTNTTPSPKAMLLTVNFDSSLRMADKSYHQLIRQLMRLLLA